MSKQQLEKMAQRIKSEMNEAGHKMTIEEARTMIRFGLAALGEMVKPGSGDEYLKRVGK